MKLRPVHLETVDSTNDHAFRSLEAGEGRAGDVFIAREQLSGRGTRGRNWASGSGGLYLSLILECAAPPSPGLWTIAGSLGALDAARRAGACAALDWPNDLVAADPEDHPEGPLPKVGGVLAETRDSGPPYRFVLGLGVNVAQGAIRPELTAERPVSSLEAEIGRPISVAEAADLTVESLETRIVQATADPAALHRDFFDACVQAGRDVRVHVGQESRVGRFETLDHSRGIGLRAADGSMGWISLAFVRSMELSARS